MRGRPAALADSLHRRPALAYLFAFAMFGLALLARLELASVLPPGLPFITFLPAILLIAFLCGRGPAIMAGILSGLTAWYLFISPANTFFMSPQIALALLFFWGVIGIGVSIIDHLRNIAVRLEAERKINADLAEQRAYLFKELQHRVANNMSFLVAILSMQKAAVRDTPMEATEILDDAIRRIRLFSSIHRRLHDPEIASGSLEAHFQGLFEDLIAATDAAHINCEIQVDQIDLPVETILNLSLIAAELMTNAIKHAFVGQSRGTIRLTLTQTPAGLDFVVSDDGVQKSSTFDAKKGLGSLIIDALSEQINAERDVWIDGGTHVRLRVTPAG